MWPGTAWPRTPRPPPSGSRRPPSLEEAVRDAEFVQENGPERVEVKREVFARLDAAAPPAAILASSSSAIVASRFTEDLKGRARCLIAHPVNPPHVVPIVELCGAPWTSAETVKRARAVYESVGQVPIEVKKEIDGFILNRMQGVLLSEAMRLVGEGFVSAEDLDKTIRDGLGLRWAFMGPFETIELNAPGGIPDYCARYGETLYRTSARPVTPDVWGQENVGRAVESWGRAPSQRRHPEEAALARRPHRRAGGAQEGAAEVGGLERFPPPDSLKLCHPGACRRDPAHPSAEPLMA